MTTKPTYQRRIKKHGNVRVCCPACRDETTLNEFISQHSQVRHGLDKRKSCIFCLGSFTFQRGSGNTIKHRIECMDRFIVTNRVNVVESQAPTSVSTCQACCSFNSVPRTEYRSTRDPTNEFVGLYDSVFETNDELGLQLEGGVEFDERSGLGKRAYWIVERFLRGDLDWYHVMVKHDVFDMFVRAMEPIQNDFIILPYWCLCDGLRDQNGRKVTHRHMILACVKSNTFREVWTLKIRYGQDDFGKERNNMAKKLVKIQTCEHLIETIVYLSTRKAKCDHGIPDSDEMEKGTFSHFFLNIPLHRHSIFFWATLCPGGVEKVLRDRTKNMAVVDWAECVVRRRGQWRVPIEKTDWACLNCVIPVAKQYEPTLDPNEAVFALTLFGSVQILFKRNQFLESMSRHQWYKHQASQGNTFRSIGEEYLILARNQQRVMNQVKRMETRVQQCSDRAWQSKTTDLELKYKNKIVEWKRKYAECQTKIGELEKNLNLVTQDRDALKQKLADMKVEALEKELCFTKEKLKAAVFWSN